jgi:hypothetical protein
MRPKVVIGIMLVAVGLLGGVIILKGLGGKPPSDGGGQASNANADTNSTMTAGNSAGPAGSTGAPPVVSPEMRQAIIDKEQEQIQELVGEANGTNNPMIISALVEKLDNPEVEVGKAALAGLVQLNDTNAVGPLQQMEAKIQSVKMKAAIEDTVTYLNLPDCMPAVPPPETLTNRPAPVHRNLKMNPAFMHTNPATLNQQSYGQ